MEIIAGTAMLALGGRLCAQRSRGLAGMRQAARLLGLVALVLILPTPLAPGVIGLGWLLSLTAAHQGAGWDVFTAGCGLLGRDLLGSIATPLHGELCLVMWLLGWLAATLPQVAQSPVGRRLRWELSQARQAIAPRSGDDAWRCRAADALTRAIFLTRTPCPVATRSAGHMICLGATALGSGDAATARDEFVAARKAIKLVAGTDPGGREELWRWLELVDWCEIAATLIDEEAPL